jgi:hypothetical protein
MRRGSRLLEQVLAPSASAGFARFRRAGAYRRAGVLLNALALLIQIWLPVIHFPVPGTTPQVPAHRSVAAAVFGSELALCLAGAKEPTGSPVPAPAHKAPSCSICLALQHFKSLVPPTAAAVVSAPRLVEPPDLVAPPTTVALGFVDPTAQARAPPPTA